MRGSGSGGAGQARAAAALDKLRRCNEADAGVRQRRRGPGTCCGRTSVSAIRNTGLRPCGEWSACAQLSRGQNFGFCDPQHWPSPVRRMVGVCPAKSRTELRFLRERLVGPRGRRTSLPEVVGARPDPSTAANASSAPGVEGLVCPRSLAHALTPAPPRTPRRPCSVGKRIDPRCSDPIEPKPQFPPRWPTARSESESTPGVPTRSSRSHNSRRGGRLLGRKANRWMGQIKDPTLP